MKENVSAKAQLFKSREGKKLAWGMLALGGVVIMATATGNAAAVDNTTTTPLLYYGMTIFEWVLAALTVILVIAGLYLKNFWALIFGMVTLIILAFSYLA